MERIFLAIILLLVGLPHLAGAHIPATYTNDNIFEVKHDKPVSLFLDGRGGFYGYTEHGFYFTQSPIQNNFGIKLHKFTIDRAFFYMSDKGMIRTETDLAALSIYLSRT